MNLVDIKDRTPNADLVEILERGVELAKQGELRSALVVYAWDDGRVSHGWACDERTPRRLMLAELVLAQTDFATKILIEDGGNVLSAAVTGE